MAKQYCFDIRNSSSINFDVEELKGFVEDLYIGPGKYPNNKALPFDVIYVQSDNHVCILMTKKTKADNAKISEINASFDPDELEWDHGISLDPPVEFGVDLIEWWNTSSSAEKRKQGKKWNSIKQRGPYFEDLQAPYKPLGASLTYDGKKYLLTPREEKAASLYANRLISEKNPKVTVFWTKDKVFNDNFWNDFKTYLSSEHKKVFKIFSKIGWEDIVARREAAKEMSNTPEAKRARRIANAEKKREYGYAFIDGHREELGNFAVEPQGMFMGRGMNPNRGKIKPEIKPNQVTLNLGPKDLLPKAPGGYKWKGRVADRNAEWVAKWKDGITGEEKYVRFARKGQFKGKADLLKYEKARKLEMHIETVRAQYMADAASGDRVSMQMGTVMYLIDRLGIRIGNERSEKEADNIVGATTIKVENITLKSGYRINLNFAGKDSIVFNKDLTFPPLVYGNVQRLVAGRPGGEQVFSAISSADINAYLKQFDKGFSAKVFRTRLASEVMYNALDGLNLVPSEPLTKSRVKTLFGKANAAVAGVLNHSRTIPPKAHENVEKDKQKLVDKRKELREKKKAGKSTTQVEKSIKTLLDRIENRTDTMAVAVGTSLQNYIDPRLVYSWVKTQAEIVTGDDEDEDALEANTTTIATTVYTADLRKTFSWAEKLTEPGWNWMSSPLMGDPALDPTGDAPAIKPIKPTKPIRPIKPKPIKPKPIKPIKPKPIKPTKPVAPTKPEPVTTVSADTAEAIDEFVDDNIIINVSPEAVATTKIIITRMVALNWEAIEAGTISEEDLPDDQDLVQIGITNELLFSLLVELGPSSIEGVVEAYGPGTLEEWRLLLAFCESPRKNMMNLAEVSRDVLAWVYPFSVYGIEHKSAVKANTFLVKYFDEYYTK